MVYRSSNVMYFDSTFFYLQLSRKYTHISPFDSDTNTLLSKYLKHEEVVRLSYWQSKRTPSLQNGIDGANVLNLDLILLDSNIVGTVVDMDTSVFSAQPHCGLHSVGLIVLGQGCA